MQINTNYVPPMLLVPKALCSFNVPPGLVWWVGFSSALSGYLIRIETGAMKKVIQTEEQPSFSSSEHQFQPREDDDQTMWDVIEILKERKGHYFVQWAGDDPQTGKPWTPTWARKVDVTDDLVEKWKAQKAERKERAAARRKKCAWRHFNNCSVPVMPRYPSYYWTVRPLLWKG